MFAVFILPQIRRCLAAQGHQPDGFLIMLSGLLFLALDDEQLSETLMGRDEIRLNAQRLVKIIRGFGVTVLGGEDAAQIITGFRRIGRQSHRLSAAARSPRRFDPASPERHRG